MARKPSLLWLHIWISLVPIAFCRRVELGGDITSLVPSCAQSCLLSFITSNYPTVDCGTTNFTLPCLCPAQSISGFTVGEGALECLYGSIQVGSCGDQSSDDAASARVLHMCSGQEGALPNTHATLTATVVVPPSGSPSLLPPTTSRTTLSTSSTTTSKQTTSRTGTSAPTLTPTATSSLMITSIVMSSFSTSSSTSSPTPTTPPQVVSAARLAPAQIAGISIGVVGAVALAVGTIILARWLRRRRYPDSDSRTSFFKNNNSTNSFDPFGPRGSHVFHISPPLLRTSKYVPDFIPRAVTPTPQPTQPPRLVQTADTDRSTIGLAISRPRSLIPSTLASKMHSPMMSSPSPVEVPLERRHSRLLPPRPALTLNIPTTTTAPAGAPSSQGPLTKDRASTMTNMTAFADLDLEAAEGEQTWRPPLSDPLSATTLYVADNKGNWVLSNNHRRSQIAQIIEPAELDTHTPLTKSPMEREEEAARMAATISAAPAMPSVPQPAFLSQDPASRGYSQSSSLYSQFNSARQSGRRNSAGRSSSSRSRKNSSGGVTNRSNSQASATTIQTSSSAGDEDGFDYQHDVARLSQLSPVQESPAPITGQSRVAYPKIPGRLDGATIRHVPPPKRPNFAALSLGQPSPTLGMYPIQGSPSAYPPPLNPRRNDERTDGRLARMQRTGSGFTPEPPNIEVFPLQSPARSNDITRLERDHHSGFAHPQMADPRYRYVDSQPWRPPRTPAQQPPTFTPSPLSSEKRPMTPPTPSPLASVERSVPHIASQRIQSGTSFRTISSNASSLLAKRLGSDRAAAFALDPNGDRAQKWRRYGDGLLSPEMASPRGTLPQTPIWKPKLTPTRRGDDLFLNVQ
ncbi:hypothetical protein F4777DRAFT_542879 [Nemania sp. FL0916]|nr:hypothetical protein F4777DRAFT_542879 [Nemania sp. FL0916]